MRRRSRQCDSMCWRIACVRRRGPEEESNIRGLVQRGVVAWKSAGQGLPAVERFDSSAQRSGGTMLLETSAQRQLRYVPTFLDNGRVD